MYCLYLLHVHVCMESSELERKWKLAFGLRIVDFLFLKSFLLELYNHKLYQILMYYNFNSSWLSNGGWEFAKLAWGQFPV